eukprot:3450665-Pyramimonas_sp.AAC.1
MRLRAGSAGRALGEQRWDRGHRGRRSQWQQLCSGGPAATAVWAAAFYDSGGQACQVYSPPRGA